MKETIKLFSIITGLFRSVITILFLIGILFTVFVDVNLLVAFFDILGFTGISAAFIKPLLILVFALMFIINFIITRHIFKAGYNGKYHLPNMVFALLFLSLNAFGYITFRNQTTNLIYVFFAFNGLIVINSILGLIAKARGLYRDPEEVKVAKAKTTTSQTTVDYLEFEEDKNDFVGQDEIIFYEQGAETYSQPAVENNNQQVINKEVITTETIEPATNRIEKVEVRDDEISDPTQVIDKKAVSTENERVTLEKDQKMVFESTSKDANTTIKEENDKTDKN